ncbi:zinc finger, CCHC-type containing protein [Tanacetum coccineum]
MHDNTMTCTRPDIAYAVGRLGRHISSPGKEHWDAVNRVFKYLKQTMDYGLEYNGDPSVLEGYTDASRITNQEDYASTSGWIFTLGGGAVSWGSKKQSCLTDSTMAAEFVAVAPCCKEAEWLRDLLINIPLWPKPMPPISVHCDSQSTLSRAYNQLYNVEFMIPPSYRERRNLDGLTPHELFRNEHKDIVIQAQRWMKEIASQCIVVGALVATMVFAATFTIPGGYDQNDNTAKDEDPKCWSAYYRITRRGNGRGRRGRGPRGGNNELVDELNGQRNGQGLGANRNVEGANGNVEGVNGSVGGAPDFLTIIAQQLQNLLPAILAKNRTLSREVAVSMSWNDLKFMMIEEFCPSHEMQKLEIELWNHAMVGAAMLRILIGHLARDCRVVPRNVNPVNVRNPAPAREQCHECGSTDHFRPTCPKRYEHQGLGGNHPNPVAVNNEVRVVETKGTKLGVGHSCWEQRKLARIQTL